MRNKEVAHEVFAEILKHNYLVSYSYLELGALLLRVQREQLYKDLDHRSYASFLADPEIAMPKSTAYLYTRIYKFYIEHLGFDQNDLMGIDISRLRDIMPMIINEETGKEWLSKARALGKIDFINELRRVGRLPEMPPMSKPSGPGPDEPVLIKYLDIVKASPCIICGQGPSDPHHFPQTSVRTDDDRKVIPLCRKHHDYAGHAGVDTFTAEYKQAIFDWFYSQVLEPRGESV